MKIPRELVATFSIVGYDPQTEELGIAVQSKFIGVGAVVPWAKAGVGAVATQSYANTSYGPVGLELMAEGKTAQETLDILTGKDEGRAKRQAGIVDAKGNAATYTGTECFDWAGGISDQNFAAQGNILVSKETVEAMGRTFQETEGSLAYRLLQALDAGQEAGGDSRGKQSAALLVVKDKGGYGGYNDRAIDLRVDDHPDPIKELIRIFNLHQLYFEATKEEEIITIDEEMKKVLIEQLIKLDYYPARGTFTDEVLFKALTDFIHTGNFEEREQETGKIDVRVFEFIKGK